MPAAGKESALTDWSHFTESMILPRGLRGSVMMAQRYVNLVYVCKLRTAEKGILSSYA